jgi:two-component system chemotaxis response regulator CheY
MSSADVLKLGPTLDLGAAEGLLVELRQRLQFNDPLCIDASAVETLTLPCVQLILAAAKGGNRVNVAAPSPAFQSAFSDLGLDWPRDETIAAAPPAQVEEAPIEAPGIAPDIVPVEDTNLPSDQSEAAAMTKRILTIDDSKTIRDMLRMTLVDAGFEVLQAVDGQDGCEVMDRETVDLVITDINMPRMNGYEVVRNLRNRPDLKGLPILVLTTESDTDKKNLAREAGATGWMVKPFDPDRLIATVRKVIP